jgi:hypothetical protein
MLGTKTGQRCMRGQNQQKNDHSVTKLCATVERGSPAQVVVVGAGVDHNLILQRIRRLLHCAETRRGYGRGAAQSLGQGFDFLDEADRFGRWDR